MTFSSISGDYGLAAEAARAEVALVGGWRECSVNGKQKGGDGGGSRSIAYVLDLDGAEAKEEFGHGLRDGHLLDAA